MHQAPGSWPNAEPPDYVREYVDWLIDPTNHPHNKTGWARDHGFNISTIGNWMRDSRVRALIDERAQELNMSPDRIQEVINSVFKAAVGGDMKAATLYLQHVDKLAPKRTIIEDRRIEQLSDAEFQAELREHGLIDSAEEV